MIRRRSLPKVLLLLAAFVFFSANTVYFVEDAAGPLRADDTNPFYYFDFDNVRKGPYLNLKAAIAVNYDNGEVLYAKNADEPRSIASISKLVSVMVIADKGVDLSRTETITKEDAYRSSRSRLRVGYELTLEDLLYAALMNSDNRATRALARATSGSIDEFVKEMNRKVKKLGPKHTVFYEPTGLDKRNVSTAHEVARLLHYANDYELITKITSREREKVRVVNRNNRLLQMANTNLFVHSPYRVQAGKTGYIRAADYCLATLLENKDGDKVTIVVLGVPRNRLRFREARRLTDWAFKELKQDRREAAALAAKSE